MRKILLKSNSEHVYGQVSHAFCAEKGGGVLVRKSLQMSDTYDVRRFKGPQNAERLPRFQR